MGLDQLSETVLSFHSLPIYGWDFFDSRDDSWDKWREKLSLDEVLGPASEHWMDLFQAGGTERHLDLRFWFNDLTILNMNRQLVTVEDFVAGGVRWWDALYAHDERVQGHGIHPLDGSK